MRLATKGERTKILKRLDLDSKWLGAGCQVRWRTRHLYPDPGYVLIFESVAWRDCVLVVSEPLYVPNMIDGKRYPRIDVHPADGIKRDKTVWSSWDVRNVMFVKGGKVFFQKLECALIAHGLGHSEWPRLFALHSEQGGASAFVILPGEALRCGKIRLPGLREGRQRAVSYSISGRVELNATTRKTELISDATSLQLLLRVDLAIGWPGATQATQRALKGWKAER